MAGKLVTDLSLGGDWAGILEALQEEFEQGGQRSVEVSDDDVFSTTTQSTPVQATKGFIATARPGESDRRLPARRRRPAQRAGPRAGSRAHPPAEPPTRAPRCQLSIARVRRGGSEAKRTDRGIAIGRKVVSMPRRLFHSRLPIQDEQGGVKIENKFWARWPPAGLRCVFVLVF